MFKEMKKIVMVFVLGIVMAGFAFGQAAGSRSASFMKIFESGTYHMKAKMNNDGVEVSMEVFVKGNNLSCITSAEGETVRVIFKDNKTHMIMESQKMIIVMPASDMTEFGKIETSGLSFTAAGTANFDGRNLPYEEFKGPDGEKTQYFFDGNRLAGIRESDGSETSDIVISELNQNVPDSVFNIPAGYTVLEMPSF